MHPDLRPDTLALHADHAIERAADVAPPIHVATTFLSGNDEGLVYARNAQPTRARLEAVLGALEGGEAVVYASGQAATTAVLFHQRPRRVAIRRGGYHGTHAAIDALAPFGVEKVPLDAPLALGADVVMHSTTKFISGHSDALGGVLVARDPAVAAALRAARTTAGSVPGALETWLALRGVRTLALRVRAASATAARLAAFLEGKVARVWHPSLASHPSHALASRQMRGPGAVLSIELADEAAARELPGRLRLFRDATSLGGVESLIEWRREHDPGAPPALLRISVGLEDADDLVADMAQGLAALAGASR